MLSIKNFIYSFVARMGIDPSWKIAGNYVGDYAMAAAIFIVALLAFKLIERVVVNRLRAVSKRTATEFDDTIVKIADSLRPPFYAFLAFWLAIQFIVISGTIEKIVTAIGILWVVYQVVIATGIVVEDIIFKKVAAKKDGTTRSAVRLIVTLAKGAMWGLGLILLLSNFGVNVTSLIAGVGIGGIAIAFAVQGILSDLFSSFSLYFDRPFEVGDFIIVGQSMGVVKQIGLKSTRIQALSGEELVISNKELTNARVQNFKKMQERRVVFQFGILYETPQEKVAAIPSMVQGIIEGLEKTRFDRAHFMSFGDSALTFEAVYYVLSPDYNEYMDIHQQILLALREVLIKENVSFAYPTRTLYLRQDPSEH